jgi:high-affinity iron transporter
MALSRLLLIFLATSDTGTVAVQPSPAWEVVYGRLIHLEEEYEEMSETGGEQALNRFLAGLDDLLPLTRELGDEGSPLVRELEGVKQEAAHKGSPLDMWVRFARMFRFLGISGRITEFPRSRPNYARAKALYAELCTACHGVKGELSTAKILDFSPPATDFLSSDAMNPLSPVKAYYALTYGEYGTAMPSFPTLSDDDRWALAFYVFTLRLLPCEQAPIPLPMRRVALSSDNDLTASFTDKALSCVRWTSLSNTPRHPNVSKQSGNHRL